MDHLLYFFARGLVALIQALPLRLVARLGRFGGGLAYWLDPRHRRVALNNLRLIFGKERSPADLKALARENFRRIGENFACAVKTAAMTIEELRPHVQFVVPPSLGSPKTKPPAPNVVVAIGHFGNFELYARFGEFAPGYQCVTTYRGLKQPLLNDLLQSLRARSGCLFFERRFEATALKETMNKPGIMLGLLADQHSGSGVKLPFVGHDCATSTAAAVFALRYDCALYTGICYRVGLAQWRVEAGEAIPTHVHGQPRPTSEIMGEVNRAFTAAVLKDPANWFWVHNRWKAPPNSNRRFAPASSTPEPAASSAPNPATE